MTPQADLAHPPRVAGHGSQAAGHSDTDPVAQIRAQLGVGDEMDDNVIVASLREIRRLDDPIARLQAALDSTIGHWLALRGSDLPVALAALLGVTDDEHC